VFDPGRHGRLIHFRPDDPGNIATLAAERPRLVAKQNRILSLKNNNISHLTVRHCDPQRCPWKERLGRGDWVGRRDVF